MTRFGWEPIYGSMLAASVCTIAIVAVIAVVTPPTVNAKHRRWLILLRSIAALVLLLTALGPSLIRTDKQPADATLLIAADVSQSMTLSDGEGSDRWSTQVTAWKALAEGLAELDDSLNVNLLLYEGISRSVAVCESPKQIADSATVLDALKPDGRYTDLAIAVDSAIQAAAGQPMAGVILMGDGIQTARKGEANETESGGGAERFAKILNSLGVPFWTVPIGPPESDNTTRDVEITSLPEVFQLFSGNQFEVPFQLSLRGLANTEVPVTLTWITQDGKKTVGAERVRATQKATDSMAQSISLTAPAPGAYRLQVSAQTQDGEWITSNNSQTAFVEVREGGGRVFFAEGAQRPEQTYLSRSLKRFPDLELSFQWVRPNQKWPVNLGDVFEPGKYDIYILGDLDAAALGTQQLSKLQARVAEGSGLVTLGGYTAYESGGYAVSPLEKVLPVALDRRARTNRNRDEENPPNQLSGPITIEVANDHPIIDLGEAPEKAWELISPLSGANRLVGPRIDVGIQVLLQTSAKQPLLVVGEYGQGRVASLAMDETYPVVAPGPKRSPPTILATGRPMVDVTRGVFVRQSDGGVGDSPVRFRSQAGLQRPCA